MAALATKIRPLPALLPSITLQGRDSALISWGMTSQQFSAEIVGGCRRAWSAKWVLYNSIGQYSVSEGEMGLLGGTRKLKLELRTWRAIMRGNGRHRGGWCEFAFDLGGVVGALPWQPLLIPTEAEASAPALRQSQIENHK